MSNKYINHGFANFEFVPELGKANYVTTLNESKFRTELGIAYVEYENEVSGVKARLYAAEVLLKPKQGAIALVLEKQLQEQEGVWLDALSPNSISDIKTFIDSEYNEVKESEALEKNEEGVLVLKEGYYNKFDKLFINIYFKNDSNEVVKTSDYVHKALASIAEIELP